MAYLAREAPYPDVPGPVGINDRGDWSAGLYDKRDAVVHAGRYWYALAATDEEPGVGAGWRLVFDLAGKADVEALDALDGRVDGLEALDADDRLAAIEAALPNKAEGAALVAEAARATAAEAALDGRVDGLEALDADDRLAAIEALDLADRLGTIDVEAAIDALRAPGKNPSRFGATLVGRPSTAVPLDRALAVDTDFGLAVEIAGLFVVAPRDVRLIEAGRREKISYSVSAATDPDDPLSDALRLGVQWLDRDFAWLPQTVVADLPLAAADGLVARSVTIGRGGQAGLDYDVEIPAGAVYYREFLQSFSADATRRVHILGVEDASAAILVDRTLQEDFGLRSAARHGLRANGSAAANAAALQACADHCRDHGLTMVVPPGVYRCRNWTLYGSLEGTGATLLAENHGVATLGDGSLDLEPVVRIAPQDGDVEDIDLAVANGWTGIVEGNTRSVDFAPYAGRVVHWRATQKWVNRITAPVENYYLSEAIVVTTTQGQFYPRIAVSKTEVWGANSRISSCRIRDKITVRGLKVLIVDPFDGAPAAERNCIFRIDRPNVEIAVDFDNVSVDPADPTKVCPVQQGIAFGNLAALCKVSGGLMINLGERNTNYVINPTSCATRSDTVTSWGPRRSVDGHGAKGVDIELCHLDDGVGAHCGFQYRIRQSRIGTDAPNAACFFFAGADIDAQDNDCDLGGEIGSVWVNRADFGELAGDNILANNRIWFDGAAAPASPRVIFAEAFWYPDLLPGQGDYGRPIRTPRNVRIEDNGIFVKNHEGFTGTIYLFSGYLEPMGANRVTQGVICEGHVTIRGNRVAKGPTLKPDGNPIMVVQYLKQLYVKGGGQRKFHIDDFDALQVYLWCHPQHPQPAVARADVELGHVGKLLWQAGAGAFRRARLDCREMYNAIGTGRPAGGYTAAIGDEDEYRVGGIRLSAPFNYGEIVVGATIAQELDAYGVTPNDVLTTTITNLPPGWMVRAQYTSVGKVTVYATNLTGSASDPPTGQINILAQR